jgi:hypothetical protein
MEVGRSIPRYQEMALLYPRSKTLQANVNEYFIIVVRFCHSVMSFAHKSAIRQFTSTLNDGMIDAKQSELKSWAAEIKDEMSLLVAKMTKEQADQSSQIRSITKKFSRTVAHQHKLTEKLRILDGCSTYDHETTWKQIRKQGNTNSFVQTLAYDDWRLASYPCTLRYFGTLGCGKSVVLANMIDDLNLSINVHPAVVVYFFVRHDLPESSKARTIIGSIVRQLLASAPDFTEKLDATTDDNASMGFGSHHMLGLLRRFLPSRQQQDVYIVIDGLDICDDADTTEVSKFLRKVQDLFGTRVCVSHRQRPSTGSKGAMNILDRNLGKVRAVPLPNNYDDIKTFIETELARCLENQSLVLGRPTLILDIQKALLEGSNGMFLWVVLQIKSLCTMETDEQIEAALINLPWDLSEIYRRLLPKQRGSYQKRVFELVLVAQRPLTTSEIREALSITPGDTTWAAAKLINDVYSTLTTCGCLVNVDEEELTVRLVHPSVEQFLYQNTSFDTMLSIDVCHRTMAAIVVTYLNYGVFETALSTFRIPDMQVGSAPATIITSTMSPSGNARSLALRLLKHRKRTDFNMASKLAEFDTRHRPETFEYHLRLYAETYCLQHVAMGLDVTPRMERLLIRLLDGGRIDVNAGTPEHTPMWEAVRFGNVDLVSIISHSKRLEMECDEINNLFRIAHKRGNLAMQMAIRMIPESKAGERLAATTSNPSSRALSTSISGSFSVHPPLPPEDESNTS